MPGPASLLRLIDPVVRGASANARRSVTDIAQAVADRRALAPLASDASEQEAAADETRLRVLPREECLALLRTRSVGRLAYVAREREPEIVPVNYVLDGDEVVVRSGPGPKLQAAERGDVVAFEVDDLDETGRSGWSVVVSGRAERATRWSEERWDGSRPGDGPAPEPWAGGPRRYQLRIRPRRITGRRLS